MNNNGTGITPTIIIKEENDDSSVADDDTSEDNTNQRSGTHVSRVDASISASTCNTSSATSSGNKRQKDISPCHVCGAKAHGYNFDQITCESCKAFFRRNALKSMDKFRCRNNNSCVITSTTRKRCKRCRLVKCFQVGMRKEWILTEEEKRLKRRKIERNRLIKQQTQLSMQQQQQQPQQTTTEIIRPNILTNMSPLLMHQPTTSASISRQTSRSSDSGTLPLPIMHMYRPVDQHMYERHRCLLKQLSDGYQMITKQYPQPHKFAYRNMLISQTTNISAKLTLVKDLTRELTQMTTSRLLHYFTLIPEFQLLSESDKRAILIKNMLAVFMFHGALTYNADNDTCVDQTTADQPYDAQYLLLVYGSRVYDRFVLLARGLTSATYLSSMNKNSVESEHTLFLLLMVVLLFSDGFESGLESNYLAHRSTTDTRNSQISGTPLSSNTIQSQSVASAMTTASTLPSTSKLDDKLHKIQQLYIEMVCRYLHDEFGHTVSHRIFQNLMPFLFDLQKLCSTLANVNLCERAEEDDSTSLPSSSSSSLSSPSFPSSRAMPAINPPTTDIESRSAQSTSPQFNSTMISGTSHLNELQKENRAPPPSSTSHSPPANRLALSNANTVSTTSSAVLSDTITTFGNNQL